MSTAPDLGDGKICYIEIPAESVAASAAFYTAVFDWKTRIRGDGSVAFDDGVGQVSGTWKTGRKPVAETGLLVYIMISDIEECMSKITNAGGKIVQAVGGDAPEITARFTDPYGNLWGLYQGR